MNRLAHQRRTESASENWGSAREDIGGGMLVRARSESLRWIAGACLPFPQQYDGYSGVGCGRRVRGCIDEGSWNLWLRNCRRVRRYIEPTAQLLIREGYQASSTLIPACHFVALCPDHVLIGYVAKGEWPPAELVELLQSLPAPLGTKRVIFRWHNLRGTPDRKEVRRGSLFRRHRRRCRCSPCR